MSAGQEAAGTGGATGEPVTDILQALHDPAVLLDQELRVTACNVAFGALYSATPEQVRGQSLENIGRGEWNRPEVRSVFVDLLATRTRAASVHVPAEAGGRKKFLDVNAAVLNAPSATPRILLTIHDATDRVEAERSCRESEERFRRFVDGLQDYAVIFLDKDSRIVRWNSGAETLFGWSADEALGRPGTLIFTAEDVESGEQQKEVRSAIETGRAEDERWHVRKSGERFFASGILTPLRDESGEVLGFTKILRDITRRHQAEVERERLLNERHALLDSAGEGIFGVDLDGRCTFINAAAIDMLGFTLEELIGSDIHSLAHHHRGNGDPYPREECPVYKAATHGMGGRVAGELVWRKDGSWFPAEYNVQPVRVDGRIEGAVVTLRDVTAELNVAERLASKRRQLEQLTHSLDLAQAMIRDADGTITFWSSGTEQLYGYTKEEAIGQRSHSLLHTQFPKPLEEIMAECLAAGQWHGDLRHFRKDGSALWVTSHWAVHTDEGSGSISIIEVNYDITARRKAEESTRRSNEALERFAYVVSHDLKEPLRTITSYLQLLERRYRGKLDQSADEFIGMAVDGAQRMRELIDSLLTYARAGIDAGPVTRVSAESAFRKAVENLGAAAEETNAQIISAPLPSVRIAEPQLTQVFQNLMSNAIKYRRPDVAPVIEVTAEPADGSWKFQVKDNGRGFDSKDAERVFALFRRLHGREIPGTGIGLAVTRRIIETYGGQIWAEGELGKGATFYFVLPA